ncbi:TPA: helix-turn-helix domain-containing protein [Providencia alcalifaciens]
MRQPLSMQSPLLIKIKPLVYKFISEEIRHLRKQKGLTGVQLGKVLHLSQQQISRYENGRNLIPFDMLLLLLFVLEDSPAYFFQRLSAFVTQITKAI